MANAFKSFRQQETFNNRLQLIPTLLPIDVKLFYEHPLDTLIVGAKDLL